MVFFKGFLLFLNALFPIMLKAKICNKVPPFLHRLREGVDITKLDFLPLDLTANDGFRYPVISFTCDFEVKQQVNGILYDIPDQVWSIVNIPSGLLNSNVQIYKTSHSVKKSMAVNADVGYSGGFFSASASYERMQEYLTTSSKYLEEVTSFTSGYNVNMMPTWMLQLGDVAKHFVDKFLPQHLDESSILIYKKFLRTFGTHYFSHGKFGGLLRLLLATDQNYFQNTNDSTVKVQASATFFGLIKLGGGFSSSTQTIDSKFTQATTKNIRYYGGKTNLLADGGLTAWEPTISALPWLFGGSLTEVSEIISDEQKRKSMTRAVRIYVDKEYLHELCRITEWHLRSGKFDRHEDTLHSYINQAKTLLHKTFPDHEEVVELGRLAEFPFEVPDWFKKTELCYYPVSNLTICNTIRNGVCAVANNMTASYNRTVDSLCNIAWRLNILDYEDWFQDVKLCYKWFQENDKESCNEARESSESCFGLNKKELFYTDNIFIRNEACRIQWRLSVPTNAPLWMRDVKLVYNFESYFKTGNRRMQSKAEWIIVNGFWTVYPPKCIGEEFICFSSWGIRFPQY